MSFVKNEAEVAEISARLQRPRFLTDRFSVNFHSTSSFVASVLPPGLEPLNEPAMVASMSNCQSDNCGSFSFAALYVACRFGETEGLYGLWMQSDSDPANQLGRDMWGEAKKFGKVTIHHEPQGMRGQAFRQGQLLIDMEADLETTPVIDSHPDFYGFELKAQPAANGIGLQDDPVLVAMHTTDSVVSHRSGPATLRLSGNLHDPLDTVPVETVLGATHVLADSYSTAVELARFRDRETYIPYIYGRNFDDFSSLPMPRHYRSQALQQR